MIIPVILRSNRKTKAFSEKERKKRQKIDYLFRLSIRRETCMGFMSISKVS